jgi:dTDP-4-dehydrorhamnose reductase
MISILLTGKNGQVGAELLSLLPRLGNLVALDRQQLDLCNPAEIRRIVRQVSPQIIVNAAAYTAVDKAEAEHTVAYAVNSEAPGVLAEEANKIGAALVHYSTDYIFDGSKHAPYDEDDSPNPLNVYGKSKLAGEIAIRQAGVAHLIFRTSWVYATSGQNFLLTLLRLGSQREELPMVRDQIGTPNWSRNIARTTMAALNDLCTKSDLLSSFEEISGTYHLSATGAASRFDFAQAICDELCLAPSVPPWVAIATGGRPFILRRILPITSAEFPTPATRPLYSVLSNKRLSGTFGIPSSEWRSQLHEIFAAQES